jgi:ferrous iron transport protein A
MTLSELRNGETAIVLELHGGHGFVGRMAALGFTPGSPVSMIRNSGSGPIIVSVMDTQIALGRGQAAHVRVRP